MMMNLKEVIVGQIRYIEIKLKLKFTFKELNFYLKNSF